MECLVGKKSVRMSIDPFYRTKLSEQLKALESMSDNSKVINRLRKEISQRTDMTEEMSSQNSNHLILLGHPRSLINRKIKLSDIDISKIDIPVEQEEMIEPFLEIVRAPESNQVVGVRDVSSGLNMSIVGQKTSGVIKRVSQMMNEVSIRGDVKENDSETFVPELVIVPSAVQVVEEPEVKQEIRQSSAAVDFDELFTSTEPFDEVDDSLTEDSLFEEKVISDSTDIDDLFLTVNPFSEPEMFHDRTDESLISETTLSSHELRKIANKTEEGLELKYDSGEELPEAFWVTQEEDDDELSEDDELSFDEQINELLSASDNGRSRKLVA